MKPLHIAVACRSASGMADMPIFTVSVTQAEYRLGAHYDKAEVLAAEAGYKRPFVCFDATEQGAILSAAHTLDLVPQIVVIDMTDGFVRSVCCDTGSIKVICYDESNTDEDCEAIAEHPVGENGQLVRCWAHVQIADADPGLIKARG
jgi:hypothetical protein